MHLIADHMNMRMEINHKSTILYVFIVIFLFYIPSVFADTVTYVKEYNYQASELDSKVSSRTIALEQVKRLLLEELGTYLEGNAEVKNFQLSRDNIIALTGGIVHAVIIDERWDGKNYWIKAEIRADPEEVARSIDRLRKDQKQANELELVKKNSDNAIKEIEKLRSELNALKKDKAIQERFNKSVEVLGGTKKETTRHGRFIKYDNGTVLDTRTNLMWATWDNEYSIDWEDAERYCESYRGGGYTDWRMPTLDELTGLYDANETYKSNCGVHVHLTKLIRLSCSQLWYSGMRDQDELLVRLGNYFAFDVGEYPDRFELRITKKRALPVRFGK